MWILIIIQENIDITRKTEVWTEQNVCKNTVAANMSNACIRPWDLWLGYTQFYCYPLAAVNDAIVWQPTVRVSECRIQFRRHRLHMSERADMNITVLKEEATTARGGSTLGQGHVPSTFTCCPPDSKASWHFDVIRRSKNAPNSKFSVAPPRFPLGSLQRPQTPSLMGRGLAAPS